MSNDQKQGLFFTLLAASAYAFFPVVIKYIYSVSDFEPLDVGFWRFIFAAPIIWLIVSIRQRSKTIQPLPRGKLILLGFVFSIAALSAFTGLNLLPASTYVVIFYVYPMMIALISIFLGERYRFYFWIALILSLIGIALTVPDFAQVDRDSWIGIGICLVNALAVAVYFLLSNRFMSGIRTEGVFRGTAWVITGALLIFSAVNLVRGFAFPMNYETWIGLFLLGSLCTALPMFAVNAGIQKLGAPKASIIGTIEPLLSMLLAVIFLGENVRFIQWVGGLLIVASIIILQVGGKIPTRKRRQVAMPVETS